MDNYLATGHSYNFGGIINRNQPFFIDPHKDKKDDLKEKRKIHQKQIIDIYKKWHELELTTHVNLSNTLKGILLHSVDLTTFNPNNRHVSIVGTSTIPFFSEQKPENETSKEDWALYHLKYERYSKTFNLYLQVLNSQVNFNKKMDVFLISIRERLKNLIGSDNIQNENDIELLLRYYLFKIVDDDSHNSSRDRLKNFEPIDIENERLRNPFPSNQEIIYKDMQDKYSEIIKSIEDFKSDIAKLNEVVTAFQASLSFVIDTSEIELKGSCPIERPNYKTEIKSIFRRFRHVP